MSLPPHSLVQASLRASPILGEVIEMPHLGGRSGIVPLQEGTQAGRKPAAILETVHLWRQLALLRVDQ